MPHAQLAPKRLLTDLSEIFKELRKKGILTPAITIAQLEALLTPDQRHVIDVIQKLNPTDYGVHIPFEGLEPVPPKLVHVSGQHYKLNGESKTHTTQLVPEDVFDAYTSMNSEFKALHPDRSLLIGSAYRSPAYQIVTFINWCATAYEGDIGRTVRHVSPPAYSQHTSSSRTAIDFLNMDGSPTPDHPEDFRETVEYEWLKQNAGKYKFFESWKEGNKFGMRAEPWHWRYTWSSK
jgi:LAS superfamily LD-carboxypeptidase LdcB